MATLARSKFYSLLLLLLLEMQDARAEKAKSNALKLVISYKINETEVINHIN